MEKIISRNEKKLKNENIDYYNIFATYITKKLKEKEKDNHLTNSYLLKKTNKILTIATLYFAAKNKGYCWFQNEYNHIVDGFKFFKDGLFVLKDDNSLNLYSYMDLKNIVEHGYVSNILNSDEKLEALLPKSYKKTIDYVVDKLYSKKLVELKSMLTLPERAQEAGYKRNPKSKVKFLTFDDALKFSLTNKKFSNLVKDKTEEITL